MLKITLIIPTHNRCDYLKNSLASFVAQSLDKSMYEIIVVDNNSTDETKKVVYETLENSDCNWKYVFEPRQGLHYARNTGIIQACSDIVVFGDDDIEASERWLQSIFENFQNNKKAGVIGGKILPIWTQTPPEWIFDYGNSKIHGVFAYHDYGDIPKILTNEHIFGCNYAIRKEVAIKAGGSQPDTFPSNLIHLSGAGECGLTENVKKLGYKIFYDPEVIVHHHVEESRTTLNYFIERHRRIAVEKVYYYFRTKKKINAIKQLLFFSLKLFLQSLCNQKKLINPKYYRIIKRHQAQMILAQTIRVIINNKLYKYIIKPSYLD